MFKKKEVIVVHCDVEGCNVPGRDEDHLVIHFDTEDQAINYLVEAEGWTLCTEGRLVCDHTGTGGVRFPNHVAAVEAWGVVRKLAA